MSLATADRGSGIAASLRAKGRPVPANDIRTNDIRIAAYAMETGADPVSRGRHFEEIEGLAWTCVPADARLAGAQRWAR